MLNEHITSLGYRLEYTDDASRVEPLLRACRMDPLPLSGDGWEPAKFLIACTLAGGTAACIGWNRSDDAVVLHSLAVAPTSRGSGIGAGLLASAMGDIMDRRAAPAMYLITDNNGARRLFESAGFSPLDAADVPESVKTHPAFQRASDRAMPMIRRYHSTKRGLDNCAFRLILNDTDDATLPPGSVFFFRQTGDLIESSYRGGTVRRGHLIGSISGDELRFCWHQYIEDGSLQSGDGTIYVEMLPDGRRELRETLSSVESTETNELLLREV
jgi:N-acetylglutamate synthase-like GNAT family acetyltransferase